MGAMCGYWIVQRMVDGVLDLYGGPHVCRWVLCLDGGVLHLCRGSYSGVEGRRICMRVSGLYREVNTGTWGPTSVCGGGSHLHGGSHLCGGPLYP